MQFKTVQTKTIARLFLAFFLTFSLSTAFAEDINWHSYSKSAFAEAKKQHKNVLLFGMASWCPWCKKMKSNVFTDSTVVSLINQKYVPVMIDIDKEAHVADSYNISVVPTNIILSGDYKVIDSKTGYLSASEMASFLRQ